MNKGFYMGRHPVLVNALVILLIAIIGIAIVFLSLNIFTKHGTWDTVPGVEDMSYTEAIKILREKGFRTDIRDSIYNEEIKPGFVVEQFPKSGSKVKPGRKIFLYINAVHPREVLIDAENKSGANALEGYSMRQGLAKLEELGFKHINVVKVPGTTDRIVRLLVNGKPVAKMQKVPINALITVEVCDGGLGRVQDSIWEEEYQQYVDEEGDPYADEDYYDYGNEEMIPEAVMEEPASEIPQKEEKTPEPETEE